MSVANYLQPGPDTRSHIKGKKSTVCLRRAVTDKAKVTGAQVIEGCGMMRMMKKIVRTIVRRYFLWQEKGPFHRRKPLCSCEMKRPDADDWTIITYIAEKKKEIIYIEGMCEKSSNRPQCPLFFHWGHAQSCTGVTKNLGYVLGYVRLLNFAKGDFLFFRPALSLPS